MLFWHFEKLQRLRDAIILTKININKIFNICKLLNNKILLYYSKFYRKILKIIKISKNSNKANKIFHALLLLNF